MTARDTGAHSGLEPVLRLSGKMLLMVVAIVASVYALLPQLTDLRGAADQIRHAQWGWAVLVVIVVPVTFVGAALSSRALFPSGSPLRRRSSRKSRSAFSSNSRPPRSVG